MRIVVDLPEPFAPAKSPEYLALFHGKGNFFCTTKNAEFFFRFVTEMESEVEGIITPDLHVPLL